MVEPKSQVVIQCKAISAQWPTVKWFKKRDEDSIDYPSNDEMKSSQPIKYFENFYEPVMGNVGLKSIGENTFLSKLMVNDIERDSVFVCVAINYYGMSFREFFVDVNELSSEDTKDESFQELLELPEKKYELLFVIPLIIIIFLSALLATIIYLIIRSKMSRINVDNKISI